MTFSPAAADTILRYSQDFGEDLGQYDMVLTGDLGSVGSELLLELLAKENTDISSIHHDGGVMIFDPQDQDVHAGGSGCGCSASVLCGHILPRLAAGELSRILFVGTGALLSPTSTLQGNSIPCIAHAVAISAQ